MAMLALAHRWARAWGVRLRVVTVDHGLRAQSASEAAMVARECAALGHPHDTLRWHWDGSGNLMDAARDARLDLIGGWRGATRHVLMAHTADDIAETFLLRLARGSGVDGLAAMAARRDAAQGFAVIRPCLAMRRAEMRAFAKGMHMPFVDDPSNDDPRYGRARARAMLGPLEDLGLGVEDLVATARRLERARAGLRARAVSVAGALVRQHASGTLIFERGGFGQVEEETRLRLLAAALMWVGGARYRPRLAALEALMDRVLGGGGGTLGGAQVTVRAGDLFVYRELAAVRPGGALWDGRWTVPEVPGAEGWIAPLGEAIAQFPDWRACGVPRAALMAMPALFGPEGCRGAPVLGGSAGFALGSGFREFLLSH